MPASCGGIVGHCHAARSWPQFGRRGRFTERRYGARRLGGGGMATVGLPGGGGRLRAFRPLCHLALSLLPARRGDRRSLQQSRGVRGEQCQGEWGSPADGVRPAMSRSHCVPRALLLHGVHWLTPGNEDSSYRERKTGRTRASGPASIRCA